MTASFKPHRTAAAPRATVSAIRTASRALVRELGFLNRPLAGTDLSPSAVHAIVEIGLAGSMTASALSDLLHLEKSTVSRLLASLIRRGEIREIRPSGDKRFKILKLTGKGQRTYASINEFAETQVRDALARCEPETQSLIADGLSAYAGALGSTLPKHTSNFEIVAGYTPGLIGSIAQMHSRYYSREAGFGAAFEARVAGGLSEFIDRIGTPCNRIWSVRQRDRIYGSIAIDGEDLGKGRAHLRWFIVDDTLRGLGAGKSLLREAVRFCDAFGFGEIDLWTFRGLDAARALYEANGFILIEEYKGDQWGKTVSEQHFRRQAPARGHKQGGSRK